MSSNIPDQNLCHNHKQNKDMTKILVRGLLYCNIPSQCCMGGHLQLSPTSNHQAYQHLTKGTH